MVHRAPGPDARLKQRIDKAAVVIDPLHVRGAGSDRLNARPRDGKTVALLVQAFGQCDVLRIEVVLIAGNVAGHAAPYFPGRMRESVPYRFALAVLVPRAFDLVGGRGGAPKKAFGKTRLSVSTNRAPNREPALRRLAQRRSQGGDGAQRLRLRPANELQIGDGPYWPFFFRGYRRICALSLTIPL